MLAWLGWAIFGPRYFMFWHISNDKCLFQSEDGPTYKQRLKEVVQKAIHNSTEQAEKGCEEIIDWIEINSISHPPIFGRHNSDSTVWCLISEPVRIVKDNILLTSRRSIVVVDKSETFYEAEIFLEREVRHTLMWLLNLFSGEKSENPCHRWKRRWLC